MFSCPKVLIIFRNIFIMCLLSLLFASLFTSPFYRTDAAGAAFIIFVASIVLSAALIVSLLLQHRNIRELQAVVDDIRPQAKEINIEDGNISIPGALHDVRPPFPFPRDGKRSDTPLAGKARAIPKKQHAEYLELVEDTAEAEEENTYDEILEQNSNVPTKLQSLAPGEKADYLLPKQRDLVAVPDVNAPGIPQDVHKR